MKRFAAPVRKPLASALLALSAGCAFAADASLSTVAVTGARFASDPALNPIGATVITAQDIRAAGVADVNAAIRKLGGVYGRQSLDASPDFGLDLRGFGSNSQQNLVVMVDGVRLSENELGGAALSTIPIETVERIEIIRGGASVLFGEGATGGVIQVVTKRAAPNTRRASVRAEVGGFGLRDLRASGAMAGEVFSFDAAVGHNQTDNYRANHQFEQDAFSGGIAMRAGQGRVGLRVDSARQDSRLPGSLTYAEFLSTPRKTNTPKDNSSLDSDRVSLFADQRFGAFDLAAELSQRDKTTKGEYHTYGLYQSTTDTRQVQFSPRLRHLGRFDGMVNEFVTGVDLIRWTRDDVNTYGNSHASQRSKAVYLRDEVKLDGTRVSAGVRRESFDKFSSAAGATDSSKQSKTAWELQAAFKPLADWELFAKLGKSYRVPNADENGYRSSLDVLKIQDSRDLELGANWTESVVQAGLRVFRHKLTNEIFYDPTLNGYGANTNLDPTRRQGFEIDLGVLFSRDVKLTGHWQHVKADFRAGRYAGREMVLVPEDVISARLAWTPGNGHSADLGVQYVSEQRYGSDFTNSCNARIPSHAVIDARYARTIGRFELGVSALNLGDKQYFSQGFQCQGGIYPSAGRQLKLSARYDF
jgi:iron complex outermembrane receptor protein